MPDYFPFDPDPRSPSVKPPEFSCDSQFHVLGDPEKYPTRPGAAYHMPSATWDKALKMHRKLGLERGIVVQTTTYGADHQVVLDALDSLGPNYKGCANALVFSEGTDKYLETLNAAGINGARFSFRKELGAVLDDTQFDWAIGRLRELGWYMKIQPEKDGIISSVEKFENLDLPIVIDHMGRPDPTLGDNDPNLKKLLELLEKGNFWVMLSLGEKISKTGKPWDDVIPMAQQLIQAAPHRIIWGSDWPHPVSMKQPPNDAELLELLYKYAPDQEDQRRILVTNPANLFGFNLPGK